jgi:hypothetical protein
VVSFKPRPLYIQKSASGTNWLGVPGHSRVRHFFLFIELLCFLHHLYFFLFLQYLVLVVIIIIIVTNSSSFFCLLLRASVEKGKELKRVCRNQDVSRQYLSKKLCKIDVK